MSRAGDSDFLGRWSARKLKARAEPAPESAPEPGPLPEPGRESAALAPAETRHDSAGPAEVAPEKTDAEILGELGLPDPDELVKGDDFKAFMRAGVPTRLRNRALRRLWLSDPVLANLDGLNDYDGDYTGAATVMKTLKSAYKVGKGFLRDEPETASAAEPGEAQEAAAANPGAEGRPDAAPAPAGAMDGADPDATAATPAPGTEPQPDDESFVAEAPADPPPRPQRMRFRFDAG